MKLFYPLAALILTTTLVGGGCFDPQRPASLQCSTEGLCPSGMVCQADNMCRVSGEPGELDAAVVIDAVVIDATPDAVPVECTTDVMCETPPDLCHLPGTCNLETNVCRFDVVSCAADQTCSTEACSLETGLCEASPINEMQTCQAPTCGAFTACQFDLGNVCDESGTKSRTCTDFECSSGSCVGTDRTDMQTCSQSTTDLMCGVTTCEPFGACVYGNGTCDESGTKKRVCTDRTCGGGICNADTRTESQPCTRIMNGEPCGFQQCLGTGVRELCCTSNNSGETCTVPCSPCDGIELE